MTVAQQTRWRLNHATAAFSDGSTSGRLDLLEPSRGLHELRRGDVAIAEANALGVQIEITDAGELALPETYVRGDDLIATYPQTERRSFRLQAYWRFSAATVGERSEALTVVELQTSMNTQLLDAHPTLELATQMPPDGSWIESEGRRFVYRSCEDWSYVELAHPTNESQSYLLDVGGTRRLVHRVFDRPLEKGVILRSRVLGAIVPRRDDETTAERLAAWFATSPVPLTT